LFGNWFKKAPESKPLKLLAERLEDVAMLAAILQDSVIRMSGMRYEPEARRFVIELSRYCHELASVAPYRAGAVLAIHSVEKAAFKGLETEDGLWLLTLNAEPLEAPAYRLELVFAGEGGAALRLEVECLDILLADLTPPRRSRHKPAHKI
jgi:hypothetical protein